MIITCISECTKKAFPRSQRVLSKYLPQIGRRSWQGPLSEEGLANLMDELKTDLRTRHRKLGLSRHTAVAIYRNRGTSETRLISIVGAHQAFSPEGHYCFSVRQTQQQSWTPLSRWQQLQLCVLRLAALFHDLGKATLGFQAKLNAHSCQPDAVRHEVVSWLLLSELLQKPDQDKGYDHQWLAQLDTPENVAAWFDRQATELPQRWQQPRLFARASQSGSWAPILAGIGWLVLSHHRLPDDFRDGLGFNAAPGDKARLVREGASPEEIEAFLRFPDSPALPWRQTSWQKAVASQVEKLKQLRHTDSQPIQPLLPGFDKTDSAATGWMGMLYHHLRPLLVTSDYLGSQQKQPYCQQPDGHNQYPIGQQIIANTQDGQPADSLTEHLLKVARWTRQLWLDLEQWPSRMPDWQQLDSAELPKALSPLRLEHNIEQGIKSRVRGVPAPFRWQPELQQQLVAARLKADKAAHQGFFGVMLAETGAGKTRAALSALCAATGRARVTTALGYRSLTVQTSQAYRDELGVRPHHLATLIGVSLERALFEQAPHTEPDSAAAGCPESNMEFSWQEVERFSGERHPLVGLGASSLQPLLEKAVVVATTDHLAHALEGDRGSQLLPMFRIASADTLFDELDSYSDQDLVSLGRWAWCCGYFGRALMLVSATLSPALVETFAAQYYAGLAAFEQRTGKPVQVLNMLASNQLPGQVFHSRASQLSTFMQHYQDFTPALAQISLETARTLPRRKLGWLPDSAEPVNAVASTIHTLHSYHASYFTHQGRELSVSTGYLLCDTVAHCQQQAAALAENAPAHWKLLCYHSAYTLLDRYLLEQAVAPLLNRKDEQHWQQTLLQHPALHAHFQQQSDLVLIICCTNILETGRDFDADWAIADLLSVRSLVQLAGRIGRHRQRAVEQPNLYLQAQPMSFARSFCQRGEQLRPAQRDLLECDNSTRLGAPFAEQIIQAAPLLHPASSPPSPHLQQAQQGQQLQLASLEQLRTNPLCWPNNKLAREKRFRASRKSLVLLNYSFDQPCWDAGEYQQDSWYCCDYQILNPDRQQLNDNNRVQLAICAQTPSNWLLNSTSRAELWEQSALQHLSPALLHSIQLTDVEEKLHKLIYSSALGMLKPATQ